MKEDLAHIEDGRIGESIIRQYFISKGIKLFQIDWMTHEDGEDRLNEVKYQEIFEPPPFYGHGLPKWQIKDRLDFFTRKRIVPFLYVVEKSDYGRKKGHHLIWSQSLIVLEIGRYMDTGGSKPRRVYDIRSFNKIYFVKRVS